MTLSFQLYSQMYFVGNISIFDHEDGYERWPWLCVLNDMWYWLPSIGQWDENLWLGNEHNIIERDDQNIHKNRNNRDVFHVFCIKIEVMISNNVYFATCFKMFQQ